MSVYFGYGNILEIGAVTVSSAATGYPGYRLYDKDVSLPWKGTSELDQNIYVDMGGDETASINRCIIAGHNLKGKKIWLYYTDDDPGGAPSWTYIIGKNPSNNEGFEFNFSASEHRAFRLLCAQQLGITDLLDEDCSDISDWTDDDNINGVSEVDPAGQFRMDANTAAAENFAKRYRDIGSIPNTFTVEIKAYHDALGALGDNDYSGFYVEQGDERFCIYFCSNGLFIHDTDDGNQEVGTDLVKCGGSAEWQTWRFVITFTETTGDGTCDVYLRDSTHDWTKVETGITCSAEGSFTDGKIILTQYGYTTNDMLSHIDYIRIAEGHFPPVISEISELYLGNSIEIKNPIYSPDMSPQYVRTREETQSGVPWIIENGSSKDSFAGNFNRLTEAQKNYILAACEETSFFFIDHEGVLRYIEVRGLRVIKSIMPGTYFDVYVDFLEIEAI